MKDKLSREESEILKAHERGELKSVKHLETDKKKHATYAKASLRKERKMKFEDAVGRSMKRFGKAYKNLTG